MQKLRTLIHVNGKICLFLSLEMDIGDNKYLLKLKIYDLNLECIFTWYIFHLLFLPGVVRIFIKLLIWKKNNFQKLADKFLTHNYIKYIFVNEMYLKIHTFVNEIYL